MLELIYGLGHVGDVYEFQTQKGELCPFRGVLPRSYLINTFKSFRACELCEQE